MTPDYPSKLYYAISEVAKITSVKAHVLRYWETEFPTLRPKKTRTGSRRYRPKDIDEVLAIKRLLYDEGFKIAGARRVRKEERKAATRPDAPAVPQIAMGFNQLSDAERLDHVRLELKAVLEMLEGLPGAEKVKVKTLKTKKGKA